LRRTAIQAGRTSLRESKSQLSDSFNELTLGSSACLLVNHLIPMMYG
jgi:hypothetical protein